MNLDQSIWHLVYEYDSRMESYRRKEQKIREIKQQLSLCEVDLLSIGSDLYSILGEIEARMERDKVRAFLVDRKVRWIEDRILMSRSEYDRECLDVPSSVVIEESDSEIAETDDSQSLADRFPVRFGDGIASPDSYASDLDAIRAQETEVA